MVQVSAASVYQRSTLMDLNASLNDHLTKLAHQTSCALTTSVYHAFLLFARKTLPKTQISGTNLLVPTTGVQASTSGMEVHAVSFFLKFL
jgi:hypothetical protein